MARISGSRRGNLISSNPQVLWSPNVLRVFSLAAGLGVGRAGVWRGLAVCRWRSRSLGPGLSRRSAPWWWTGQCGDPATVRGAVLEVPGVRFVGYCAVSDQIKIVRCFAPGVSMTRHPWEGCCGVPRGLFLNRRLLIWPCDLEVVFLPLWCEVSGLRRNRR